MKYSIQKEYILEYLKNTKEHPTAERIYAELKPALPHLSLATVYRNLGRLCQAGHVIRLTTGDKVEHYDADVSDHQHFVCTSCGAVSDLFFCIPSELFQKHLKKSYTAERYQFYVYGTCDKCSSRN